MKKFLIILSFLPLVGFCNEVVYSYTAYTYNSSGKLVTSYSPKGTNFSDAKYNTVFSLILNQSWVPISFNTSNSRLMHPSFSSPFTNSVKNASFPFLGSDGIAYSFGHFPEIANIFVTIIHLYNNGYRNDNFIKTFLDNGPNVASTCNVSPLNIYLDVLNGTNTLYRQIILSSLKDINTNLLSIDDQFFNFIDLYRTVNSESLSGFSNLSNKITSLSNIGLLNMNNANFLLSRLDTSGYDLKTPEQKEAYNSLVNSISSGIKEFDKLNGLAQILQFAKDPHFKQESIDSLMNYLGSSFNQSLNSSINETVNNSTFEISTSIGNATTELRAINTNSADLVTNLVEVVTNIIEEAEKGRRELEALNNAINQALKDIIADSNAVKVVGEDGGAVEVVGENGGVVEVGGKDGGAVEVTGLDGKPIIIQGEVTLDDDLQLWVNVNAPIGLDEATLQVLTGSNDLIEQTLIDFKSLFQQWYQDDEDNSWLKFFDMARDWRINEIADNTSNQVDVAWEIHSAVTNILASMTNEFNALLLTDYEQFVSNGVYDSMVSLSRSFQSDCLQYGSSSYSDMLDSLGLGSGEGNWWQYITVHLGLLGNLSVTNYYMMSYVFSNLVATVQYANDQLDEYDGFFGIANKVISSIPKEEDVISQIDSITNSINTAASGFDDVYSNLDSTSNKFNQAITTYYIKKDLPDNIELRLLPDIDPFEIPVGEHRELFDLLRMGMAFAISIVNIILLPKFILKLFTLFFGVVDSQIKIASMDQSNI